jgi:hypothetical protein
MSTGNRVICFARLFASRRCPAALAASYRTYASSFSVPAAQKARMRVGITAVCRVILDPGRMERYARKQDRRKFFKNPVGILAHSGLMEDPCTPVPVREGLSRDRSAQDIQNPQARPMIQVMIPDFAILDRKEEECLEKTKLELRRKRPRFLGEVL